MQSRRDFTSAFAAGAALSLLSPMAFAQPVRAKNVVLVHGSCWSEVIPRLQSAGLNVTSVQNPLTTLDAAVASA